ncbi:hypothetical protein AVEN_50020-1 [Araneus ventricosus]|uniref:Uncharacterized protein n=1 Tax=Araneus ventricosus TaxID=182803 RepID=A0A4Y2D2X5_ARAVE|nr:hypothetical protein AVEN_50020-1 [Araneus ventricosus]
MAPRNVVHGMVVVAAPLAFVQIKIKEWRFICGNGGRCWISSSEELSRFTSGLFLFLQDNSSMSSFSLFKSEVKTAFSSNFTALSKDKGASSLLNEWSFGVCLVASPIHDASSVESGFKPVALLPRSRDLTTRPPRPSFVKRIYGSILLRFGLGDITFHVNGKSDDPPQRLTPVSRIIYILNSHCASDQLHESSIKRFIMVARATEASNLSISEFNSIQYDEVTSPYQEEWESLFSGVGYLSRLKSSAMKGKLRTSHFRSVCWKLFLRCLPENRQLWIETVKSQRQHYEEIMDKVSFYILSTL